MHRNAAKGGPIHGQRQSAHKILYRLASSSRDMLADKKTHTHTQTNWSQYSAPLWG